MAFRDRLQKALRESGLSQAQVARRIEATSASRIGEWKTGKGTPGPAELLALAQVLNVQVGWLAGADEPMRPTAPSEEAQGFRDIAAVVDRVRALASAAEVGVRSLPGGGKGGAKTEGEE